MGLFDEKSGGVAYSASPISPSEPMSAVSRNSEYLAEFEKKDLVSILLPFTIPAPSIPSQPIYACTYP
jgi:hypothetical protein